MRSKLDPAIDTSEEQRSLIAKRRKLIISGGFIAVALILLLAISSGKLPGCSSAKQEQQKAIVFDKSGDEVGNLKKVKEESYGSEEELLKLAKEAKAAGLVVQGVSQCGWTRRQRELFGGAKSKARKVFESMYIECRSRDQCPNVKGYPTWSRGDQMYPGFKNPDRIRELIKEVGQLPPQQQVQDSSLPNESNIPGIKPTVMDARLPQSIKAKNDTFVAETHLLNQGRGVEIEELSSTDDDSSSSSSSDSDDDEKLEGKTKKKKTTQKKSKKPSKKDGKVKKEHIRGVSKYPPLNVLDMPGTAAFTINSTIPQNQWMQNNLPRQSLDNPDPVQLLARQMAATFSQIAYDASRDSRSADFGTAKLKDAAHITSGYALDDKRIYVEKN